MPDYELRKLKSTELEDFKDDVRTIINEGKFQYKVIDTTGAPTQAANKGETVYVLNGASGEQWVYMGFAWDLAAVWTATTA